MENMIKTIWSTQAMYEHKEIEMSDCPISSTGKEVKHICKFVFFDWYW